MNTILIIVSIIALSFILLIVWLFFYYLPKRSALLVKKEAEENRKNGIETKNTGRHWILWWKVDVNELKNQIERYNTLKITESARGQSVLLIGFSIVLSVIFIQLNIFGMDSSSYFDVLILAVLALFIHGGHRWAIIGAMIFWTFEKIYIFFDPIFYQHASGPGIIMNVFWWSIYMSAFWLALKTENGRRNAIKQDVSE